MLEYIDAETSYIHCICLKQLTEHHTRPLQSKEITHG